MLVILGFWRHVYRRFTLRYDRLYWGAVFPLGMYSVCRLRNSFMETAGYHVITTKEAGLLLELLVKQRFDAVVLCSSIRCAFRKILHAS